MTEELAVLKHSSCHYGQGVGISYKYPGFYSITVVLWNLGKITETFQFVLVCSYWMNDQTFWDWARINTNPYQNIRICTCIISHWREFFQRNLSCTTDFAVPVMIVVNPLFAWNSSPFEFIQLWLHTQSLHQQMFIGTSGFWLTRGILVKYRQKCAICHANM